MIQRLLRARPVVLDIDDWEVGLATGSEDYRWWHIGPNRLGHPNSILYATMMEGFIRSADSITVTSDFLKEKYGGVKVPHGRDTSYLDPQKYPSHLHRSALGLGNEKHIVFLGTPRVHKGIAVLASAVRSLGRRDLKILIVGATHDSKYSDSQSGSFMPDAFEASYIERRGYCSFPDVPKYLSVADIVVLPQRDRPESWGQVPAKLFDAMAMARPIVASAVSDIPQILDGCGIVVPPDDPSALADAIQFVIDHPVEAKLMGLRARERCIQEYSLKAMQDVLFPLFETYQ